MSATASGSTPGPYASAAALYSQHLARPPSAYSLVSGSGRKGRRRPRSASTSTPADPGQPAVPYPPSSAPVSPNNSNNTRIGHETPLPQTAARPASAAPVCETRPRPTASRPSRPRPATATGMAYAHRSKAPHHQRSNVVKGPAWGYDKQHDEGNQAEVHVEGPARRDATVGVGVTMESGYWHESKSLEVDPVVLRRAEEFVAKILHAQREGQLPKAQEPNGPPIFQPEAVRHAHLGFQQPQTGRDVRAQHGTKPGSGAVKYNRVCRVDRGKRGRGRQKNAVSTTSAGTRITKKSIPTFASRGLATETELINPGRMKTRRRPEGKSMTSADVSEFPFPAGESNRSLGNAMAEEDGCFARDQPSFAAKDSAGGDGEGNNGDSPAQESQSLLMMTPLNFDVFCSMRPTLLTRIRTRQRRQKSPATSGVHLSVTTQEDTERNGNRPNREAGRRHCEVDENQPFSAWDVPPVGNIVSRRPPRAWASIFGAVCAGAERGRARAEVLEAARRESLRQSKRRRRAADDSAADSRAKIGHLHGTPTFPATTVRSASTNVAPVSSTMSAADTCCALPTYVEGPGTKKLAPCGESSCEKDRDDTENEGTRPSTPREPTNSGVQSTPGPEIADSSQARDVNKVSSPSHDVSVEVREASLHDTCNRSTPKNSSAQPIAKDRSRHSPCTAGTTPLFRHPFGGGTTRVSVNAPRSLQVCPGERGFDVSNASKTSRHCFSLPRGGGVVQGQQPSAMDRARRVARWQFTAGSEACAAMAATCGTEEGAGDGEQLRSLDTKAGAGPRPETAGSFFSRSGSGPSKLVGAAWINHTGSKSNRGSASPRWTNGECLRQQVDRILDTVSSNMKSCDSTWSRASGTCCQRHQQHQQQEQRQAVEKQGGVDDTADRVTHETETWSTTQDPDVVYAKLDFSDNGAQESDRGPPASESRELYSTDDSGSGSEAVVEPVVESEVDGAATGSTTRRGSKEESGRGGEADGAPRLPRTPAVNAVRDNPVASGGIVPGDVDSSGFSAYQGLSRLRPRPSSAPSRCPTDDSRAHPIHSPDVCVAVRARRSGSSPGLMQPAHNTAGSSASVKADSKGTRQSSDRYDSNTIPGETGSNAARDGGTGRVDNSACPTCTPCAVVEGTISLDDGRDVHDPPVPDRSQDGEAKQAQAGIGAGGGEDHAERGNEGTGGLNERAGPEAGSTAASIGMETRLDFAKATVKLKVMAAEASVAVDEHEKAWGVSKEKAEVLFNDLRLAPEEDAQQSGHGAASETRNRLQRIMVESGVERSRRVGKEADLEELRRVLLQDTTMYAARKSASDRLLEAARNLEAENDSCDHLLLLECRRGRSLSMLRERTERDRDGLRAACHRKREEAEAMDVTLEEARHAHGRLLGHVQHLVERLSCLGEYVSVMRRWCQEHLESRRHARITSKAINLEFGRKSEELDALLRTKRPTQSVAGASKVEVRRGRKSKAFETAGATGGRTQDHSDKHFIITTNTATTHIAHTNFTDHIKVTHLEDNADLDNAKATENTNTSTNPSPLPDPKDTTDIKNAYLDRGELAPPLTGFFEAASMLRGSLDALALKYRPHFRSPFHPLLEK